MKMNSRPGDSPGVDRLDTHDPFADFEEELAFESEDLEVRVLRTKKATLCDRIDVIVDLLEPTTSLLELKDACDELVSLLCLPPMHWSDDIRS